MDSGRELVQPVFLELSYRQEQSLSLGRFAPLWPEGISMRLYCLSLCSRGHQPLEGLENAKETVGSICPGNHPLWLGFSPRGWTEQLRTLDFYLEAKGGLLSETLFSCRISKKKEALSMCTRC